MWHFSYDFDSFCFFPYYELSKYNWRHFYPFFSIIVLPNLRTVAAVFTTAGSNRLWSFQKVFNLKKSCVQIKSVSWYSGYSTDLIVRLFLELVSQISPKCCNKTLLFEKVALGIMMSWSFNNQFFALFIDVLLVWLNKNNATSVFNLLSFLKRWLNFRKFSILVQSSKKCAKSLSHFFFTGKCSG